MTRVRVNVSGLSGFARGTEEDIADILTRTARQMTDFIKADLRGETQRAGLGTKLSNAWRGRTFPGGGRNSLEPASYVKTNAPKIIDAFSRRQVIRPKDGRRYLAIPTNNVPRKGRRLMTPLEVEVSFNQDLIEIPSRRNRRNKLLFISAVKAKSQKGWRRPTKGRVAQGRTARLVLMFVLVPSVSTQMRIDLDAVARRAAAAYPGLLDANWR